MEITVSIPESLVSAYSTDADLAREMLEAYALENYRQQNISLGCLAEILELSIDEAHGFLKQHNVPSNYDREDMERDLETLEMFLKK